VGRIMRVKDRGAIFNIVAGAGEGLTKEAGAYIASKAGLAALSQQADMELSPHGIRVYTVENSDHIVSKVLSILEAK
jgi:NAD(P)-dependent dehydrogenase (short-subunit alcohol dehydrogenase family)